MAEDRTVRVRFLNKVQNRLAAPSSRRWFVGANWGLHSNFKRSQFKGVKHACLVGFLHTKHSHSKIPVNSLSDLVESMKSLCTWGYFLDTLDVLGSLSGTPDFIHQRRAQMHSPKQSAAEPQLAFFVFRYKMRSPRH